MNEKQYQELCNLCDKTLLAKDISIERVANNWLHVIREHPIFLSNYDELFEIGYFSKILISKYKRILRNYLNVIKRIMKALINHKKKYHSLTQLPTTPVDFLFVSHLMNESNLDQEEDIIYGNIPIKLNEKGYTVVIIFINHTTISEKRIKKKCKNYKIPKIILKNLISASEEIRIFFKLRKESARLSACLGKETNGLKNRFLSRASQEALSPATHENLRIYNQFNAIISELQPSSIIITHEGHAWERMIFSAARQKNTNIKLFGYQHSALFRLQHAVCRKLNYYYNPDKILTSGQASKIQLKKKSDLDGIDITVIGSNRSLIKSNEYPDILNTEKKINQSKTSSCLVLPEGIISECHLLFEFSYACAELCPDINFIWRLHPIISFESLLKDNIRYKRLPDNIILSNKSIYEDIFRCKWAMYRGSTAIVQAAMAGLTPIYLESPGEMSIDPLYELNNMIDKIKTPSEFKKTILSESKINNKILNLNKQKMKKHCEKIYEPFDYEKIENILCDTKMN